MFPLIKAAFMGYIHLVKLQKEVLPTHLPLTSVCLSILYPCEYHSGEGKPVEENDRKR